MSNANFTNTCGEENQSDETLKAASLLLDEIYNLGYLGFIVGGAVRDKLLDRPVHDVDIVTTCPLDVLEANLKVCADVGKNRSFGIVVIEHSGFRFEVSQFRSSIKENVFDMMKTDAGLRDFTINGMFMDSHGEIYDFYNGKNDLKYKILRCPESSKASLFADPIRMMRAIRFAVVYDMEIGKDVSLPICKNASMLNDVSPERVFAELWKMASLTGPLFSKCVYLMKRFGILNAILPEISVLSNFVHNPKHHPEGSYTDKEGNFVFGHVLSHVIAAIAQNESSDPEVNLAILFHDIGKGVTARNFTEEHPYHNFYGHDDAGVPLIETVANRLCMSNRHHELFAYCTKNHMRVDKFHEMRKSKIMPIVTNQFWPILKQVSYCDNSCRKSAFDPERHENNMKIAERVLIDSQKVYISGNDVMELCKVSSGPVIGQVIRKAKDILIEGLMVNKEDAILEAFREVSEGYENERS